MAPTQFDGVLLPGGALNADTLRVPPQAQEFVRVGTRNGLAAKPIAVIGHAPVAVGLLGLCAWANDDELPTPFRMTCRNAGANRSDEEIVRDGNWVSRRRPSDIPDRGMIEPCSETRKANQEPARRVA